MLIILLFSLVRLLTGYESLRVSILIRNMSLTCTYAGWAMSKSSRQDIEYKQIKC